MLKGLKFGDFGAYVELVQLALKRSVDPMLAIDGVFGRQTEDALRYFQAMSGLGSNGVVDASTQEKLAEYLKGYSIVRVGPYDTYYRLARRFNTSVSAIRNANPGVNPTNLEIGQKLIVPYGFDLVADNIHYTYYYLQLLVDGFRVRFPFCSYFSVGNTVLGKEIFAIRIGVGNKNLMYNAAHHANEWITTPLVLKYFEAYATAVLRGGKIYDVNARMLFEKTGLMIIPMVNADGVDLVNGVAEGEGYTQASAIASHFPDIAFPDGWKANISGTDLNLNYPAEWERAKQIKYALGFDRPAPRDYVGEMPLSAPESIAMANFTEKNDFLLTISYHTQGNIIYWKFDEYNPPRALEIGNAFSASSGYPLEITPFASGAAGYKDWFIQQYNRPGYTVEVGVGTSPVPLEQFGEIYKNNIGIMTLAMHLL